MTFLFNEKQEAGSKTVNNEQWIKYKLLLLSAGVFNQIDICKWCECVSYVCTNLFTLYAWPVAGI